MHLSPRIAFALVVATSTVLHAQTPMSDPADPTRRDYFEPQILRGETHAEFIETLPISRDFSGRYVNALILGQDSPNNPKGRIRSAPAAHAPASSWEPGLTSRSDIIALLSFDRERRKATVYSLYRGVPAPDACFARAAAKPMFITDYYAAYGRKAFLPCVLRMFGAHIQADGLAPGMVGRDGAVQIHALFEASRDSSLVPATQGVWGVLLSHAGFFSKTYGPQIFRLRVAAQPPPPADLAPPSEAPIAILDGVKMQNDLMERHRFAAEGFQRAFNSAQFLADLGGWAAPGFAANPDIAEWVEPTFEKMMSYTTPLADFSRELQRFSPRSNPWTWMAARQGKSLVRIVQFGWNPKSYFVYDPSEGPAFVTDRGYFSRVDVELRLLPRPPDFQPGAPDGARP